MALAPLAVLLAIVIATGGTQSSPSAARADASRVATVPALTTPGPSTSPAPATPPPGRRHCPLAVAPDGYVNPLAGAIVKPERIDQGVDYAGVGKLAAIGAARITFLATGNVGWSGAFIEYQLLDGADAGCYVYYAEGVTPAPGLRVGQPVSAGQPIATIIPVYPTGIEIGWAAGVEMKTYALVARQWNAADDQSDVASAAGKNFSSLIAALGGPPGKDETGPATSPAP